MFKGNNRIVLNEATMIEAVQFWLNDQHKKGRAPKVDGVRPNMNSASSGTEFIVSTVEPE